MRTSQRPARLRLLAPLGAGVGAGDLAPLPAFDWRLGSLSAVAVTADGCTAFAGGERGMVVQWDVD